MLCLRNPGSGGGLEDAVDEGLAFDQQREELVSVEAAPAFLGGLGQFEHHRQARPAGAIALGAAVS